VLGVPRLPLTYKRRKIMGYQLPPHWYFHTGTPGGVQDALYREDNVQVRMAIGHYGDLPPASTGGFRVHWVVTRGNRIVAALPLDLSPIEVMARVDACLPLVEWQEPEVMPAAPPSE
jgi:hypothetical protein